MHTNYNIEFSNFFYDDRNKNVFTLTTNNSNPIL